MAVESISTTAITNLDALPSIRANPYVAGAVGRHYVGQLEVAAAATAASTYRFFRVGSWMRISSLSLAQDAISAGTWDFGLYRTLADGGAVVASSVLASTVSGGTATLDTAITLKGKDIANSEKRIWELLGLTTDPNLEYDVTATTVLATGNAGTLVVKATGVV